MRWFSMVHLFTPPLKVCWMRSIVDNMCIGPQHHYLTCGTGHNSLRVGSARITCGAEYIASSSRLSSCAMRIQRFMACHITKCPCSCLDFSSSKSIFDLACYFCAHLPGNCRGSLHSFRMTFDAGRRLQAHVKHMRLAAPAIMPDAELWHHFSRLSMTGSTLCRQTAQWAALPRGVSCQRRARNGEEVGSTQENRQVTVASMQGKVQAAGCRRSRSQIESAAVAFARLLLPIVSVLELRWSIWNRKKALTVLMNAARSSLCGISWAVRP